LRDFEEIEIEGKAVEVTVNSKVKNSEVFCLDFVQEFCLSRYSTPQGKDYVKGGVYVIKTLLPIGNNFSPFCLQFKKFFELGDVNNIRQVFLFIFNRKQEQERIVFL
jgi:hypothetical protein